jgi:hypothetical protein
MLAQWHEGVGSWLGVVKSVLIKECAEGPSQEVDVEHVEGRDVNIARLTRLSFCLF